MNSTFTKEKYKELIEAVDKLPKEAVEFASKELTRKGYDTTGYQYQFLVNVLNEVVGVENWTFTYKVDKELQGQWSNGKTFWEVAVDVEVEILGSKRSCAGGHKSEMYADAKKGAITNALKKTLGLFGIGKKAYEGTIDDDYLPLPETPKTVSKPPVKPPTKPTAPLNKVEQAKQPPTAEELNQANQVPF